MTRLAAAIRNTDDDTVYEALQAQLTTAAKEKKSLTAERSAIEAELTQREYTEADRAMIEATAAAIRRKLGNAPTFQQKRELPALLELRVDLQHKDSGRALYVTCGLKPEGDSFVMATSSPACAGTPSPRADGECR